jgi:serine/threonine-protein kinase
MKLPARLSRFQREARTLAALNHANIATIYGFEQNGGTSYLVMELVPGETLAERVKRDGAIPIEEALGLAKQIAGALEAAHERNIIHRDLKPANVKLTTDGKVKVLDFGLAKAFEAEGASEDPSNSPTLSRAATKQGIILGTAAYMSPEQARGKACDKRTDIWAFGCVLYELLTGKPVFQGESTTEILAAVLREEADWQALPAQTPRQIRELLGRCLQKDLRRRLHDAADARIEIEEALAAPATAETSGAVKGVRVLGRRELILGLGALLLAAVITGLAVWNLKPSLPQPVSRLVINLPPGQQLAGLENGPAVSLSSDGTYLAYVARQGSTQQIYLRALDSLESKPIPGTEGAVNPFFSPDGQWLGFFSGGKLKKVSVSGGAALMLGEAGNPRGAAWGSQGMIAYGRAANGALQQVPVAGGTPHPLTRIEKGEVSQRWPEFLPGGKAVLFTAGPNALDFTNAQIGVQSLGTGERRNLIQGGTQPRYSSSGHLVYAQGGSLMAVLFDSQRLTATGVAVPMVEGVLQSPNIGDAEYSISDTGSLAYVPGGVQSAQRRLAWVGRNGAEQPLAAPAHAYVLPRLSPDGRRVAVTIQEPESQVWLYDLARETLTRFTFEGNNGIAIWTPDGKRIVFNSNKEGPANIFWQLADGSGGLERLTTSEFTQVPISWSPDGQLLAFVEVNPTTGNDIWVLRMRDTSAGLGQVRKAQPFLRTPFNEALRDFPPTGTGWPISRTNPDALRSTCNPIRGRAGSGKSRRKAARNQHGTRTGESCFTAAGTR